MLFVWGLCGAFIYAAPQLVICCRGTGKLCILEFGLALAIGGMAAGGYAAWLGHYLQHAIFYDRTAFAITIGLIANPLAPLVVKMLGSRLKARLGTGDEAK